MQNVDSSRTGHFICVYMNTAKSQTGPQWKPLWVLPSGSLVSYAVRFLSSPQLQELSRELGAEQGAPINWGNANAILFWQGRGNFPSLRILPSLLLIPFPKTYHKLYYMSVASYKNVLCISHVRQAPSS